MKTDPQPHQAGPEFTLDEFGQTYQDINAPKCPGRK